MTISEILGFITGIAGVYLTMRQNPWCFPVGLVNVTISIVLFFDQKLYADVLQQAVYIILLIYGWYKWIHPGIIAELKVTKLRMNEWIKLAFLILGTAFLLGYLLREYTDATLPYLDSFATALAFAAQYLIAKKKIENWLLWIPVNIIYIGIYINRGLPLYAILFAVYLILAISGYLEWKKALNKESLKS
jgi:nicotinamide mononucleotide transporter